MSAIDQLLDELASRIAICVVERLRAGEPGWISQADSPLGRKHNSVVRGRTARGESGAAIIGRRHLLSPAALAEELDRLSGQRGASSAPERVAPTAGIRDELERELRLVRGGGRRG